MGSFSARHSRPTSVVSLVLSTSIDRTSASPFLVHAPFTLMGEDAASLHVGAAGSPVATRSLKIAFPAQLPEPVTTSSPPSLASIDVEHESACTCLEPPEQETIEI